MPRHLSSLAGAALVALLTCCAHVGRAQACGGGGGPLKVTSFSVEPVRGTSYDETPLKEALIEDEPYAPPLTQAGAHPWGLATVIEFEHEPVCGKEGNVPTQEPKDILVDLPPGLLANPMAVPRCSLVDAFTKGECPASTIVGFFRLRWAHSKERLSPIADVVPEVGQSAEFALVSKDKISAAITGHLVRRMEGGREMYELAAASIGIPTFQIERVELTFWGEPADPSHDALRGLFCDSFAAYGPLFCTPGTGGQRSGASQVPFLTLPAACAAGSETATLRADSWEEPGQFTEASATIPAATGCEKLAFHPTIQVRPDTLLADEPVGLDVGLAVPQAERPEATATPQLRDATVTLPEGLSVNPSVVDGIRACEPSGPEGIDIAGPESERLAPNGEEMQLAPGHCPDASAVGTAEAITPLLSEPIRGHVYLARPGCGGAGQPACTEADVLDGNLYRLYLELGGEGELASTGVHFKVEGRNEVDPATGQITTVFEENPQTPFSELKVHLNGGPRAPLANPAVCGPALTTAEFTSWSAPGITPEGLFVAGVPEATPSSFFEVRGCSSPTPFAPSVVAGTVKPQAGQFTSFTLNLERQDREQYAKGVQVHTPPGLLGVLANVPLCSEQAADAGSCPASSKIGTTRVATGAGSHPFEIEGDVYLTGPHGDAPFGLSIVVHVDVGPFHLGAVVVRARIAVDRSDSTLTVTTDETGPYAVPQIVFGVPVRLRRIAVNVDRPDFMFNPTDCASAGRVTTTVSGSQGASATVATPFAVTGCKSLAFKPHFAVSTSGRTSRARGASLDAKLTYPKGAMGRDANVAYVKVSLPRQLPSYLPTLQKACLAETFDADPASCPAGSIVGIARASTPLLPVGLSGPVYFVSHGGAEFPSLVIVLQGYGVRVDLVGSTFIAKGVTSSTFKTVPDVPVGTFELYLPQGKNHALAANGDLCNVKGGLKMPTEMVAHNGLVLRQATKIAVSGCKAKGTASRARGHAHGARARGSASDRRRGR